MKGNTKKKYKHAFKNKEIEMKSFNRNYRKHCIIFVYKWNCVGLL